MFTLGAAENEFPYHSLQVHSLRISLRLRGRAILPSFKGSTFRGLLGRTLLDAFCPKKIEGCLECKNVSECPYPNFFKPHLARAGRSTPAPYVVVPAIDKRTHLSQGETVEFELRIFGVALKWLPFILAAMFQGGERGALGTNRARFDIVKPIPPAQGSDPASWASARIEGLQTKKARDLITARTPIRAIRFATPCKLKEHGMVLGEIRGETLLRALERRIAGLNHFYAQPPSASSTLHWSELPRLETELGELSWVILERPSTTQVERVNIGGWVGRLLVRFYNNSAESLLRLGQWTHVGKNTVYGCGKILLEEI